MVYLSTRIKILLLCIGQVSASQMLCLKNEIIQLIQELSEKATLNDSNVIIVLL